MEIRRVQMTGGSSYIITLPKEWVKTLNIQKNDPVGLFRQSDGTLLITSKMNREQTQKIKEFDIKESVDENELLRKLVGAYISGYNSIKIKTKQRLTPKVRRTVRNFTQNTIGQEVVEETSNTIVLKDLLNPAEMPFNRTIKRMHIMVKGMFEDIMHAFRYKDKQLAKDILTRDNEIDRLHWLVARQHNIIEQNINFAEKMGITPQVATTSFLISRILERIGDHIIKIAKNVTELVDKNIDEKIIDKIEQTGRQTIEILNQSIGAFSKKDLDQANKNIDKVENLNEKLEELNNLALKQKPDVAIALGYIIESIRRIGDYAEDISESVINYLIGQGK